MSKEVLTHSESYVKKTNRIILVVGLTSFVIFVIGVMLLMQSGPVQEDYTEPVFTDNDDALNISNDTGPTDNIEFGVVDDGEPPDRKSTRLNSSHTRPSRMPSSA